jgi:Family of unknown function (DUF6283)
MKTWKLKNPKQCKNCPWRTDHDKSQIPAYSKKQHKKLKRTIAKQDNLSCVFSGTNNYMACHESTESDNRHCIGWLVNQAGKGNNIGLRIELMSCENTKNIEVFGEQFKTFEETL